MVILMTTKELLALPIAYGGERPQVVSDPLLLVLSPEINRVFLFPESAKRRRTPEGIGEVKSRRWGWVDVEVGGVKEEDGVRVLTESSFTGEDFNVEDVHPARFVRSLRRRIAKSVHRSVRAVGTDVVYKSTRYTDAAVKLAREGVAWKQQVGFIHSFEPADADPK